jgi:hypothetical protein
MAGLKSRMSRHTVVARTGSTSTKSTPDPALRKFRPSLPVPQNIWSRIGAIRACAVLHHERWCFSSTSRQRAPFPYGAAARSTVSRRSPRTCSTPRRSCPRRLRSRTRTLCLRFCEGTCPALQQGAKGKMGRSIPRLDANLFEEYGRVASGTTDLLRQTHGLLPRLVWKALLACAEQFWRWRQTLSKCSCWRPLPFVRDGVWYPHA